MPQDGEEGQKDEPILNAEQLLQEISSLFDQYQKALSEGKWTEAGEIMEEIERRLNQ